MDNFIKEESFKDALDKHLEDFNRCDKDEHAEHHEWLRQQITREQKKCQFCTEILRSIVTWAVTGLLGYSAYWIFEHAMELR